MSSPFIEAFTFIHDQHSLLLNRTYSHLEISGVAMGIAVVIGLLENQGGALGDIAGRLIGTAWSLVTFLSVPVIAIEGTGPVQTLKRSGAMFRQRWGQQITGNLAIGGAVFLHQLAV